MKEWFSTGKWGFERTKWVFLTSKPALRERILPLHSAWLDLFILRMMEPCANPAKPVWFVLDELASLNKLPQLHTAVTEKSEVREPRCAWLPGPEPARKTVRPGRRGNALAASHQDLL